MVQKTETKIANIEREYVIPLREKCRSVARYKKTNKAIKTIKEFLVRHMKIRDRDLKRIRLDRYLNEFVWARGIRNPPPKVKVKAIKEGDIVRVELAEVTGKLKFKKAREEKFEAKNTSAKGKKSETKEEEKTKVAEDKSERIKSESAEIKEKKASVVEEGAKIEKMVHQEGKHNAQIKSKKVEHQVRKSLSR